MSMRQFAVAAAMFGIAAFTGSVVWYGLLDPSRRGDDRVAASPSPGAPAVRMSPPVPGEASRATASGPSPEGAERPASEIRVAPPPVGDPPLSAARTLADRQRPASPDPAEPVGAAPTFDIVRVEPTGEAVIAGRAAPNATVELLRDGRAYARTVADASGLFALIPAPLPPGEHEVVLKAIAPDGTRSRSRQSVTVTVMADRRTRPLVAMASPDRPTVLLSNPEPPPPPEPAPAPSANSARPAPAGQALPAPGEGRPPALGPSAQKAPTSRPDVRIVAVEAHGQGKLVVSGQAAPGATVRLYLNDAFIAPGGAGSDGRVSFSIGKGVRPGDYRVRLDDVDPVSGEVRTRAEVAFGVPNLPPEAVASAPQPSSAPGASPVPAPVVRGAAPTDGSVDAPPRGAAPGPADSASPQRAAAALSPSRPVEIGTVVVPEVNTAIVARGDNLWRISRRVYGEGLRYGEIYGANQPQIRDPDLIYPGQVFVLPPGKGVLGK